MSIFGGLEAEEYDRNYSDAELFKRILTYFKTQQRYVLTVIGMVLLMALADLAQPFIFANTLGNLKPSTPLGYIVFIAGVVLAINVLSWLFNLIRRRNAGRAIGGMVRDLRNGAFRATIAHDMSFFDEFQSGKIISRITSDTSDFAQVVVMTTDVLSQLIVMITLLIVLFNIDWHLALVLILTMPVYVGAALSFRRVARFVSRKGSRILATVNSNIQESIAGISVAKNFRQEASFYEKFNELNAQSYSVNWRRGFVIATIFPVLTVLVGLGTGLILDLGAQNAAAGLISVASWILFMRSLQSIWDPLMNISSFWSQFQSGLAAAERVFGLIDASPAVVQTDHQPVPSLQGDIQFKQVHFSYSDKEVVLPALDLHICPGETVAFVGHTGAGKSSIAKLTARLYEFQGGDILIDGRDIRTLDLAQYRRHLGIVPQVPFLFSGTVMDNIRYARPEATDAEILDIANSIGKGDWIDMLPNGLHSDVGERGARLSMGQRQLVALTRVLIQHPTIFILDEATASIDPFTETQIQAALTMILERSTAILIAHRLSTVRSADRIVVLRKGQIIEQGNHASLMQQGGHYAELYDTYFRHQSLEYINTRIKG